MQSPRDVEIDHILTRLDAEVLNPDRLCRLDALSEIAGIYWKWGRWNFGTIPIIYVILNFFNSFYLFIFLDFWKSHTKKLVPTLCKVSLARGHQAPKSKMNPLFLVAVRQDYPARHGPTTSARRSRRRHQHAPKIR